MDLSDLKSAESHHSNNKKGGERPLQPNINEDTLSANEDSLYFSLNAIENGNSSASNRPVSAMEGLGQNRMSALMKNRVSETLLAKDYNRMSKQRDHSTIEKSVQEQN